MIIATITDKTLVLEISGELSGAECDNLRRKVLENLGSIPPNQATISIVFLDMRNLTFMDSGALGVLMGLKATCRTHGAKVVLRAPSPEVRQILLSARYDLVFEIIDP